jgi:hypothetical protein
VSDEVKVLGDLVVLAVATFAVVACALYLRHVFYEREQR